MELKLDLSNIHKKLAHLSHEDIYKLIERYYAGEKIKDLAKEYNLGPSTANLHTYFPMKIYEDKLCPFCNIPMVSSCETRTRGYYFQEQHPMCPDCRHDLSKCCRCNACEQKRIEEYTRIRQERMEKLYEQFKLSQYEPININSLNLAERIYLGALLRAGLSEDAMYIRPYKTFEEKMTPTDEFDLMIINLMYDKSIIRIHPDSPFEAFEWKNGLDKFDISKVCFYVNVFDEGKSYSEVINGLVNPKYEIRTEDEEELIKMWQKIAYYECVEFLIYNMNLVGFKYSIGERTKAILEDLLKQISTSQVFNFIYNGANNTLRYYEENRSRISKNQAVNTFVGYCQRRVEKYLANGIPVYNFRRGKCFQSIISELFFNRIIKIGDDGFNKKPDILNLQNRSSTIVGKEQVNNEVEIKPKRGPSVEQLAHVIYNGDDSVDNVLILKTNAEFELVEGAGDGAVSQLTYITRWGTYDANHDYVGKEASKDDRHLSYIILWAEEAWEIHKKTGRTNILNPYI